MYELIAELVVQLTIKTLIPLTTILGIFITFASWLILFIISIAEDVKTNGIVKQNLTNDQWLDALEHNKVIASHLSKIFCFFIFNIYYHNINKGL